MVRLTRIVTHTGDRGETRLAGGQKVAKDAPLIEAGGAVDELSAAIGVARAENERARGARAARARLEAGLRRAQNELANLGAELSVLPRDRRADTPRVEARHVRRLEADLEAMNEELPSLPSFVLPGGGPVAAHLHIARTVCRRAERAVVRLARAEAAPVEAVRYLNRLSDWLFVAARWIARKERRAEPLWEPEKT